MYESFYGFRTNPFSLVPDPRFLFLGTQHKTALNLLEYGLFNRAMFTVITGEPGTGKTTLLNTILEHSQHEVTLGVLSHTHAGLGSLMPWVLMAFNLEGKGLDSVELYRAFASFIAQEHERQRRVVLVVDEAQNLGPAMLEELRLLSNVNDGRRQPLQIILSGQPALRGLLQRGELVQFAQRISVDYHLTPFGEIDTPAYIAHRTMLAGGAGPVFTEQACAVVHRLTGGNARLINQVCDVSLAYGYAEQSPWVTAQIVWKAASDRRAGGILPVADGSLSDLLRPEEAAAEDAHMIAMPVSPCRSIVTGAPASDTESSLAMYKRGLAYKQAGAYKQAIELFEQAATDGNQSVRSQSEIALCLCATGRHEEAVRSFSALLEEGRGTDLELRNIRYFLGRSLESLGKPPEALAHYQILRTQESGFRDVESRMRRLSSARSFFSLLLSLEPTAWIKGVVRNCTQLLRSSS